MQSKQQQLLQQQQDDVLECLAGRRIPTNDEQHFAYKLGVILREALAEKREEEQKK